MKNISDEIIDRLSKLDVSEDVSEEEMMKIIVEESKKALNKETLKRSNRLYKEIKPSFDKAEDRSDFLLKQICGLTAVLEVKAETENI